MRVHAGRMLLCILLAAALPFSAWAAPQEPDPRMEVIRSAEQLIQQQKPDEALEQVQELLDEDETYAPAYFVAGLAYGAKGDSQGAFDSFTAATEYQPGWGDAHRQASMYAADLGDIDTSWDHAIQAHLAGTDMSDAFELLPNAGPPPDDLEMRLAASRVWVAPMNLEQYLASEENPFGRVIDEGGSDTDTDNVSNSRATNVAGRVVSESSVDRASVMRRTRQRIADSRYFGLVNSQEQAQYILVIEADEIGERSTNRPFEGYLNLLDAQSGEQAHRMRIEMRNIASQADVNRDLDRIIGLLEDWAEEQQG